MLILKIDSREQAPLQFRKEAFDEIIVEGLPFGDYWAELDGKELPLIIERKSLGDLFGTMGSGYKRFKKEMLKAKEAKAHMILGIEANMRQIAAGYEHSTISGDSILKKLAMLRVRHDIEVAFFNSKRELARWIEELFGACKRNYEKIKEEE